MFQCDDDAPAYRWSLADSVFASYNMDTTKLLDKCFEDDWAMGKVGST